MAVLAARAGAAEAIDASYPAGRVEEVVVETAAGAVSLVAGGDESVRVTAPATGDECAMSAGVGGGVLTLVARGPAKKMFALDKTCAAGFTIRAPAGTRIKVRTITGSVDVGGFAAFVDVKTGAGNISLNGPTGRLSLHAGRGAISGAAAGPNISAVAPHGGIDLRGLAGSVTASASDGHVALEWVSASFRGEIRVQTSSGGQSVVLPSDAVIDLSMRSASGRVRSEFHSAARAPLRVELRSTTGAIEVAKSAESR